jgi:hypothetical protein
MDNCKHCEIQERQFRMVVEALEREGQFGAALEPLHYKDLLSAFLVNKQRLRGEFWEQMHFLADGMRHANLCSFTFDRDDLNAYVNQGYASAELSDDQSNSDTDNTDSDNEGGDKGGDEGGDEYSDYYGKKGTPEFYKRLVFEIYTDFYDHQRHLQTKTCEAQQALFLWVIKDFVASRQT